MTAGFSRVRQRTVRLIATANHKPPVLERLVASFGERSKLELLESATSGRLNPPFGEPSVAVMTGYGSTYVNAAFAYRRPDGSRFNPREWGAWYSAFTVETALEEVGFHLTRALTASGSIYDNTVRYVEILATFDETFFDLRKVSPIPSCLHPEAEPGYVDGQHLAEQIRSAGGNGIVYPSVRQVDGTCLVAFWPHLVTAVQQGATWQLVWGGSPTPTITKI